jgi:hypothetical protein
MAYQELAQVNISLATATTERVGFGVPLFVSAHRFFPERVRVYSSITSVAEDFDTNSLAYAAALSAFSQSNGLSSLMIGRREADMLLYPTVVPVQNDVYELTIEVNDGDKSTFVYTETAVTPDEEDVVTGIKALIDADLDISGHITTTIEGTGATAKLKIVATLSTDFFVVTDIDDLSYTFESTETAEETISAIDVENSGYYTISADDKTPAYILAMSISGNARTKQYWVSTYEQDSLAALPEPATDTLGLLAASNAERTVGIHHQGAATTFPEMAILAYNLPFDSGSIVWGNDVVSGVAASTDPATGENLSETQKTNLLTRKSAFFDKQGGAIFFNSDVKTMSGERPENVRGRDNMEADMTSDLRDLLLQQVGTKIPLTLAA